MEHETPVNPEDLLGAQAILAYMFSGPALDGVMNALEDPNNPAHGDVLEYLASRGFSPSNAPQMGQTYGAGEAAQAFGEGSDGPNGRAGGYQFGPYALNNGAQGSGDDDPLFWMGRGTPLGGGDYAYNRAYAAEFISQDWREWHPPLVGQEQRADDIRSSVAGGTYRGYAQGGRFNVPVDQSAARASERLDMASVGREARDELQEVVRGFLNTNYDNMHIGEGGGEQSGTLRQAVNGAKVEVGQADDKGCSLDVSILDLKRRARQNEKQGVSTLYYGPRVFQGRRAVTPSEQPYLRFKMNGVWMTSRNARAAAPKNIFEFSENQMRVIGDKFASALAEKIASDLGDRGYYNNRGTIQPRVPAGQSGGGRFLPGIGRT